MQALLRINEQEWRNDDEEQGEGIGPDRPILITFQRRSSAGFDDTLDEEADFGEFVNPHVRQRGGKQ